MASGSDAATQRRRNSRFHSAAWTMPESSGGVIAGVRLNTPHGILLRRFLASSFLPR
jgi:hypothetical protein